MDKKVNGIVIQFKARTKHPPGYYKIDEESITIHRYEGESPASAIAEKLWINHQHSFHLIEIIAAQIEKKN